MGQYRKGTATFTSGDATVTFAGGTTLLTSASAGDLIKPDGTRVWAEIGSITSDTELELAEVWNGDSVSGSTYVIHTDFTPNLALPYPVPGDTDTQDVLRKAFLLLDAILSGTGGPVTLDSPVLNGTVTMPEQPAFLAKFANTTNVTGDGTTYDIPFSDEIFDHASNFNAVTGVFTAPTPGRYLFTAEVYAQQFAASHTGGFVSVVTSNRTHYIFTGNFGALRDASNELAIASTIYTEMDAGDTAKVSFNVSGGSKVIDLAGLFTVFGGCQVQ